MDPGRVELPISPCEGDVIPLNYESPTPDDFINLEKECTDRDSNPGYWLGRPKSCL